MPESNVARESNLLAALSLGLADRARQAAELAAGHGSAAPAALVALHEALNGASIDELRNVIGLTPSGAVRLVDKLSAAGLVERRSGRDWRSVSVVLTRRGRATAQRVLAARREAFDPMLAELTEDERTSLTPLVEKLLAAMTSMRQAERELGHQPPGGWLCRLCDLAACGRDTGRCPVASTVKQSGAGR